MGIELGGGAVEIRKLAEGDAEVVAELTQQLGYARSPEQIRAWVCDASRREADQAAFVSCVDGEVAGWIEVCVERRLQSEPFALIGGLVVKEDKRGRGIGRMLCERAEQWAWDKGLKTLRVTSRITREGAHRFYLHEGYELVKTSLVFEKK